MLYNTWLGVKVRYPEGNFRTNQLLDVSMGLSPLSPAETSDLHVSTVGGLPPKFPSASANPGLAQHLSGPTTHTITPLRRAGSYWISYAFTLRFTFLCDSLACMIDSSDRVSRREVTLYDSSRTVSTCHMNNQPSCESRHSDLA